MLRKLAIVGAALALGGCASVTSPAGNSAGRPSASPSGASSSNRAVAVRDEQHIIASFRPPAGAKRLPGRPTGAGSLNQSTFTGMPSDTVHGTQWWAVGGDPQAVLARLAVPKGASKGGSSQSDREWSQDFSWTPIPAVLYDRLLEASTMAVDGRTVIRVDAEVIWYPTRPPASLIPAGVSAVTVTYRPVAMTPSVKTYGPVNVTDPATVAALVKAVNDDPVNPIGTAIPCPFDGGGRMTLTFRSTAKTVATTSIETAGCGFVSVAATGGGKATLIAGADLAKKMKSLIGVDWPDSVK
ncbi:MAG TPA: hypothetical protein VGF84_03620 [Micromonosporaceae bacterium]